MPIYTWIDKKSSKKVDVVRTFDDYQVPPTEEESGIAPQDADWERLIGDGQRIIRGPSFGKKGYW